tara:strand:+ start:736 stop:924 length:189 start_codon:yes stop_codon:yes gene_type:complete
MDTTDYEYKKRMVYLEQEINWYENCEDKTIAMSTNRYKEYKEELEGLQVYFLLKHTSERKGI